MEVIKAHCRPCTCECQDGRKMKGRCRYNGILSNQMKFCRQFFLFKQELVCPKDRSSPDFEGCVSNP